MIDREERIQTALGTYENSAWGRAVADPVQATGLCKRASLVLLEMLNRAGIKDAELWHLGMPKEGSGFAPTDEHYVVVIGAEAIDATAKQFDETNDAVTRCALKAIEAPWRVAQPVLIGHVEPFVEERRARNSTELARARRRRSPGRRHWMAVPRALADTARALRALATTYSVTATLSRCQFVGRVAPSRPERGLARGAARGEVRFVCAFWSTR